MSKNAFQNKVGHHYALFWGKKSSCKLSLTIDEVSSDRIAKNLPQHNTVNSKYIQKEIISIF